MSNPFIIAFMKLGSGLIGLFVWAALKFIEDQKKLKSIHEAILLHTRLFPNEARPLYGSSTKRFMKKTHPATVSFKEEVLANGIKALYITIILLLVFFYHNVTSYCIVSGIFTILGLLAISSTNIIKDKSWYKWALIVTWLVIYATIVYSEYELASCVTK